jgi:hypothetical protein
LAGKIIVGMTDETPKPKRKRWRWIIAGVLLFVASAVGWWNWPRGDARFIGKWTYVAQDGMTRGFMTFRANGAAISEMPNYRMRCSWRVENERLILDSALPERLVPSSMRGWLTVNLRRWTGTLYSFGQSELSVVEVSDDRLVLMIGTEARTITYERLPE